MNLPFIDPYTCAHLVGRIYSEKLTPSGHWTERVLKFRCSVCGAIIEESEMIYTPPTVH